MTSLRKAKISNVDDLFMKRFEESTSLKKKPSDTIMPKPGTEDYVNKIVLKPMTQEQIKFKLDWYNTMTQRTVTCTKVRGKQSQECWVCGYSSWCRNLEYNFSCFEDGIYLKWCCDCMAKEMGGKFMPSPELQRARSKNMPSGATAVGKRQQRLVADFHQVRLTKTFEEEEKKEEHPDCRMSPHSSTTCSSSSSDESTAVMSPMSTSSHKVLSSEQIGHFLCTQCSCSLEELRTSFSDEDAVGFQCTNCRNEYYCLLCAHEAGGRFCNASTCGSFLCGHCQPRNHEDYFYCTDACEPRRNKNNRSGDHRYYSRSGATDNNTSYEI